MSDLPQFGALLKENRAAAEALKSKRAPLNEQLKAKARVSAASELLDQHRDDIWSAEGRITELQHQAQREETLAVITKASARYPEIKSELEQVGYKAGNAGEGEAALAGEVGAGEVPGLADEPVEVFVRSRDRRGV